MPRAMAVGTFGATSRCAKHRFQMNYIYAVGLLYHRERNDVVKHYFISHIFHNHISVYAAYIQFPLFSFSASAGMTREIAGVCTT